MKSLYITTSRLSILLLGMLIMALLSSCEDELDVQPRDYIDEQEVLSDPENAEYLINGIYAKMLDWNMYSFSWLGVASIAGDDADKGSTAGDSGGDKNLIDDLNFNSSMISVRDIWEGRYDGIYRANNAIFYIEQLNLEQDYKNRLIAEAKFLRSLFYFDLVRVFGGVPLVVEKIDLTDIATVDEVVYVRKTKQECYAQIESDLLECIENLPTKSQFGFSNMGRATQGAAQALLAKVYLYDEKWMDAFNMSGEVIGSGEYGLIDDYTMLWRETEENGLESIFEVQAVAGLGLDQWNWVQGGRGIPDYGWGFNSPTSSLANSYAANDVRKQSTILNVPSTLWDGFEVPSTWNNPRYNYKAYHSRTEETWTGDGNRQAKNYRILKYNNVLLIRAEAAYRTGNTVEALLQLNQLRARAGVNPLTTVDEQSILNERRWELGMENERWFDIIRFGVAPQVMATNGKNFVAGVHEVFPIPETQIVQSNGLLHQNPGY